MRRSSTLLTRLALALLAVTGFVAPGGGPTAQPQQAAEGSNAGNRPPASPARTRRKRPRSDGPEVPDLAPGEELFAVTTDEETESRFAIDRAAPVQNKDRFFAFCYFLSAG